MPGAYNNARDGHDWISRLIVFHLYINMIYFQNRVFVRVWYDVRVAADRLKCLLLRSVIVMLYCLGTDW